MKRFVAMFLSMTLILSCIPIQVFALENTWDDDGAYSDMEWEPFGDGSGDLQGTEEKIFSNEDYGYTLTVAPAEDEVNLRTGTALRYSLESDGSWQVEAKGVYGHTLVVTAFHDTEGEYTLLVSLVNGSVMYTLPGGQFEFHPVLSGTFREWTAPDALYQFGSRRYGDYVLCDDPDTVSPLLLVKENETYDVFNTETGEYFDYDFERFSFGSNDDYYIADGVLIGYTDSLSEEMFCITETGEPLFGEDIRPLYLDETLHFIVQNDEGKYGVYNLDGTVDIDCKYDRINDYSGRAAVVRNGSYYYVADENGPLCDTETYISISPFSDGVAVGHRLVWGWSGQTNDEGYYYATDDLIFDDGRILDLARLFSEGKYATVHSPDSSPIDPSAICVEVESYVEGVDNGGYHILDDYELIFRGIINGSGEILASFGEDYIFTIHSYFDHEGNFYNGENSFIELDTPGIISEDNPQYLATKNGNIIEIPAGADYEYVKDNYLLIHNSEDAGGGSYLLDEKGEEIWSSEEPVSAPSNKNRDLLSPHIILDSGVFFLETKTLLEFPRASAFSAEPDSGTVNEDLLVLKNEDGNYSVFNDTGEILSGLPSQPYITPANRVLAAVDNGYLLAGNPNYVYELQYYDKDGKPLWEEDTYFSRGTLNNFSGNTAYLYGILVLTADGRGYLDLDGDVIVAPQYEKLNALLPGRLLFGETESAGVLLDAETGSVIAEIDFGRSNRIYSTDIHNGAVSVENGDNTQYVIYPWAEGETGGETGGEASGTVEITSAPEYVHRDTTAVVQAEYITSTGDTIDPSQVTWETSNQNIISIESTSVDGNRLSATIRGGSGRGEAEITVSLDNGNSGSVSILVLPAPAVEFSYSRLTPYPGSEAVLPNISLTSKLQISYDREIEPNQGYLLIYEEDTNELVEAIPVSQAKLSKLDEIEFNTSHPLNPDTEYYVVADAGLVRDAEDPSKISAAIDKNDGWHFTTVDLDIYDHLMTELMTEEELFLEHPEFLTGDRFLKSVNTFYGNLITSIDRYDRGMASLFYVAENIQGGDPITVLVSAALTFTKIANLPEETQEDMVKAILLYATQSQNYMNMVNDDIWVKYGADIAKAVQEVTPEGTKVEISKCIRAIYESVEGAMPEFFPEYDETFMTGLIHDTDFDNAFVRKLKEFSDTDVDLLSVFQMSMIGIKIFTEYLSTQQIAVELLITLQDEMKRAGLADDTYETLERIKSQISSYSSLREGLVDFIPEMADILSIFVGAVNTPLDYTKFSLGTKAVSFVYEQVAGSTEEILNAYAGAIYSAKLRCILEFEKKRFQEFRATTEDIQTFKTMYQLYIAALYQTGNALLKVDIDKHSQEQLERILEELEKYSYAAYRDTCLYYAQDYITCIGAKLEYEIRDGKAYITGFPEDTSVQTQTSSRMWTMSAAKVAPESLILTSEAGEQSWLVIPEEIDGYPVAGIDDRAFAGNETLRSVYVLAQLESVGEEAFSQCRSLEIVDFLQGVQKVGQNAFAGSSVEIVSLGCNATTIGEGAFTNCSSLQYIVIDNLDATFAANAVENSSKVEIIALPGSDAEEFAQSNSLKVDYPEPSVQAIRVERQPDKTHYTVGEALDLDGMVLDLTMSDGSHEKATSGWLAVGETDHIGNTSIIVLYGTNSTQLTIHVVEEESIAPDQGGQDSGNGGDSGGTTFGISVDDAKNGSITITPKRASRGSVVTITAEPDAGYVLDSLQVFDRNGKEIALRKSGDRYTFIMPASQVSVKAVFAKQSAQSGNPFLDVLESDYFYDAVLWAVSNGITAGTSDTAFNPNAVCTRAQTVTMLWRAAGSPQPRSSANPFHDVKESDYYYTAVLWAAENGITAGTGDASFSPDAICNRSQVITFLYRDHGTEAVEKTSFTDVEEGAYYYDAVQWAAQEGITAGTGPDTFGPDDSCTRAQIVTFLYKALAN